MPMTLYKQTRGDNSRRHKQYRRHRYSRRYVAGSEQLIDSAERGGVFQQDFFGAGQAQSQFIATAPIGSNRGGTLWGKKFQGPAAREPR
jgi:hypothetical protein